MVKQFNENIVDLENKIRFKTFMMKCIDDIYGCVLLIEDVVDKLNAFKKQARQIGEQRIINRIDEFLVRDIDN